MLDGTYDERAVTLRGIRSLRHGYIRAIRMRQAPNRNQLSDGPKPIKRAPGSSLDRTKATLPSLRSFSTGHVYRGSSRSNVLEGASHQHAPAPPSTPCGGPRTSDIPHRHLTPPLTRPCLCPTCTHPNTASDGRGRVESLCWVETPGRKRRWQGR